MLIYLKILVIVLAIPIIVTIGSKGLGFSLNQIFNDSFSLKEYRRLVELYLAYCILALLTEYFTAVLAGMFGIIYPLNSLSFSILPPIFYLTLRTNVCIFPSVAKEFFAALMIAMSLSLSTIFAASILDSSKYPFSPLPAMNLILLFVSGVPLIVISELMLSVIKRSPYRSSRD